MKKMIAILLILLVAAAAVYVGVADSATPSDLPATPADLPKAPETAEATVSGLVSEVTGDYVLILTPDGLRVQANLTADTVMDTAADLVVGDWVTVAYNGMMTRSLPAQITAVRITGYALAGTVGEMAEDGFLLMIGEEGEQVFAKADAEQLQHVLGGMPVTVYYNGMMTRSIPGEITAEYIRTQVIAGEVSEAEADSFLLTDGEGIQYRVFLAEGAAVLAEIVDGAHLRVAITGTMTMSLPAQVTALEVLPAAAE